MALNVILFTNRLARLNIILCIICAHIQSKPQRKINQPEISWDKFQLLKLPCTHRGRERDTKSELKSVAKSSRKFQQKPRFSHGHRGKKNPYRLAQLSIVYVYEITFSIIYCQKLFESIDVWFFFSCGVFRIRQKLFIHSFIHFMCDA